MKWPGRLACRVPITSGVPVRCRNSTSGQCLRSWSRYVRLSAEQLITPPSPQCVGQPLPDRFEPRVAVVVVERLAGGHLGDVGRRMKVVGVGERHPQPLRQRRADGRLAGARTRP